MRRLRREGKIPAVIYGHGTDPLPVAIVARELRIALNSEAGANQLLSLDTGSGTYLALAREMQRHPVAQTVTHVDFIIVRRDEVISADVPIVLVGEALEVQHGDGLVDQQMFTLAINALPTAIPSAIEADISELTIGGQVRVSDLSLPTGVTTDIDPESAVAIGQPPRVTSTRRRAKARAKKVPRPAPAPSRSETRRPRRAAKRARPCAAPLPGRSTGGHRRTCSSSGWATPESEFAGSLHNAGSDTVELLAERHGASLRAEKGVQARSGGGDAGRAPGGPGRPDHVHERLGVGRALAGHALRDRRAVVHRDRARRARPPAGHRAPEGGGRPGRAQRAALGAVAPPLVGLPAGAHRRGQAPSAAQGASHVLRRPPKAVRELLAASVQTAADAVERIVADGMDAAMLWCHSLPT